MDVRRSDFSQRALEGYRKIKNFCKLAGLDGFRYVWINTCCINKTSSAELSEAINSMYRWYEEAGACYVYLVDVEVAGRSRSSLMTSLGESRWFRRGWTLQELLAPHRVRFYDKAWAEIGTTFSLHMDLSQIIGINVSHMIRPLNASIAAKMSWASGRTTTRVEDMACSLIGLFGVNMPLLYGEGRDAFMRLQHEIVKISDDESIFAWQDDTVVESGAFARSPSAFRASKDVTNVKFQHLDKPPYTVTHRGLAIELRLERIANTDGEQKFTAALQCAFGQAPSNPILIELTSVDQQNWMRTSAYELKSDIMLNIDRGACRRELVYIRPTERYDSGVGIEQAPRFYVEWSNLTNLTTMILSIIAPYQCNPLENKTDYNCSWRIDLEPQDNIAALLFGGELGCYNIKLAIILIVSKGFPQMNIVIPSREKTLSEIVNESLLERNPYNDRVWKNVQDLTIMAELRRRPGASFIDVKISNRDRFIKISCKINPCYA